MYSIGEKIKELRKEQDMTQAQLAEKLGVTYQAVSKWENGTASPDISIIPDITRAFSVSADVLFDLVNPDVKKEEIYADYRDILDNTNSILRARRLLEKAIKEFPLEYRFYILLGRTVCECVDSSDWALENDDIQYAVRCFNKVIDECTDKETVDFAKFGKYVIYSNIDDKALEQLTKDDLIHTASIMSKYMKFVDPNWEKN